MSYYGTPLRSKSEFECSECGCWRNDSYCWNCDEQKEKDMREWQDESPSTTFLGKYEPIAAKEYHCQICGEKIKAGIKYKKHVYKNHEENGRIETFRMCINPCNVMD